MAQTKSYHYYIGPWVWDTSEEGFWKPPAGTVGLIDLRSLSGIGKRGGVPEGYGFFAVDGTLSSPYVEIGNGYIATIKVTNPIKNAINSAIGYKPTSSTLLDVIWEICTTGSDATGDSRLRPLMPSVKGDLELHLGGHSLIKKEKFVFGVHPHTDKVKAILQNDYRKIREEFFSKGSNHYLKVLDFLGEKYKVDPQEFIPDDLPKETPIKHETVIKESFNTADSDTLGPDLSWTETVGDVDVVSNQAKFMTLSGGSGARAGTALSSSDNYSQSILIFLTNTNGTSVGNTCRQDTNSNATVNLYYGRYLKQGDFQLYKAVNGSFSSIGTYTESLSEPITLKTSANGSTISVFGGGVSKISVTDTSVSSGTYSGIRVYNASGSENPIEDNFEAGDLAVATWARGGKLKNII